MEQNSTKNIELYHLKDNSETNIVPDDDFTHEKFC